MISDVAVLKGAEAISIYGVRAVNGIILITTNSKTSRTQFRDYAFWQPELITDNDGKAKFVISYPDNITGWETHVLAMDKKRRIGITESHIKSYKPVMAELSTPQFLTADDSAFFVGKALNYTNDNYTIKTNFSADNKGTITEDKLLAAKDAMIALLSVHANEADTLKASYSLQTTTGFKDGEERKVPVVKRGTEETTGKFMILKTDTSFLFNAEPNAGVIYISAQNNTLDILLEEINHLREYPYFCMEQTSSKLKGLLMLKQIKESLHQPFKEGEQIDFLLQKIQKSQSFDGGWSWWGAGKSDLYITNYVIESLLKLRGNVMVESNIRNGLLYLQNQLPKMEKDVLLTTLATMTEAKHSLDYEPWFNKLNFDSLSEYQQWRYVQVKKFMNKDYGKELKHLSDKAIPGMLGELHWGEDNYHWYNNDIATTTLAYKVLKSEKNYDYLLTGIIQYFLEQRQSGYWKNTVESASIVSAILPDILQQQKNFTKSASVHISGDTSFAIQTFPAYLKLQNPQLQQINISKEGGGLVYFSLYQKVFNPQPLPVTDKFLISTYFEKNGLASATINAGEKINLVVSVNVKKEAEYVMIEIPIPAGCVYGYKGQDASDMHREYMKNKVVLFTSFMNKGVHQFTIALEPRYKGKYTLNPAKASLMYFPVFYGRNELKEVRIQ